MLNLFSLLEVSGVNVTPNQTKLHFASNQGSDPLLAFYSGKFKTWQEEQTRKNFERPYVISLIQLPERGTWLFSGLYRVNGVTEGTHVPWIYSTELVEGQENLVGRVVLRFQKDFRNSYVFGEKYASGLVVIELRRERAAISEFPGYKDVLLTKAELDVIVSQNLESWRAALSSVSGIYLIVDQSTGKQYVGSAYGEGGIWTRWCQYYLTRHGGNEELVALLRNAGSEHANNFQFAVLEVCDLAFTKDQVIGRESHWKNVLCSKEHGLNRN
ncbi:MAG: GIY-YIG nuclease family protein [Chloroflexi bacterium]|nr:GIY-YIG nuclease family protein [Chloroflexota bacterium]